MVEKFFFLLMIVAPLASAYREKPSAYTQISTKGEETWLVDNMQSIFRWNGISWENVPGWATNVGASPDGWTWVISADFSIQRWNPVKRIWEVMPGQGYQVNAISKDVAVVVGVDYAIYMWKVNGWTKIGERAIWVAIGEQEEVWAVNRYDGSLWQWKYPWLGLGGWEHQTVTGAVQVGLQNSTRIVYSCQDNNVYKRDGYNWSPSGGACHGISINKNSVSVICTNLVLFAV